MSARDSTDKGLRACHYCETTEKELRPYGPGGSWVCFPCATSTPEREQVAQGAFGALLDAVAEVAPVVSIGTQEGPIPFPLPSGSDQS